MSADVSTLEPAPVGTTELTFPRGLPGFPGHRRFSLVGWGEEDGPYSVLVDLDTPQLRFLVVPPAVFFPSYEVDLDDATVAALDLRSADEALLLVIISATDRAESATANLLGPIVVNTRNRQGMQAVLAESGYGTRVPLLAAAA